MNAIENAVAVVTAEARALRATTAAGEALHAAVGRFAHDEHIPERVRRAARRAWRVYCVAVERAVSK